MSDGEALAIVYVAFVALAMATLFFCHWYVGGGTALVYITENDALCVFVTVRFCGWMRMAGGTTTCNTALLVNTPARLLAMIEYTKPSCVNGTLVSVTKGLVAPRWSFPFSCQSGR